MDIINKKQFDLIKPLLGRYFLYAFGLLDVLLLPKLISTDTYGEFEYTKSLILLFPNALFGVYSGYTYLKYVKKIDTFDTILRLGTLHTVLLSLLLGLWTQKYLIILPLIFINLYTLYEQKLKVDKHFITIFFFKPILSLGIVVVAYFGNWSKELNADVLIFFAFLLSFSVWFILVLKTKIDVKPKLYPLSAYEFKKYIFIIKKIISSVLVSTLLSLFFFSERYFIEKYYHNFLGIYSFGYNLCQILIVLISSLAYISTVTFGEQIHSLTYNQVSSTFIKVIAGYFSLFILYIIGIFIIAPYYKEFENIPLIVAFISFSKGLYFAIGILTPILVYKDFNNQMFVGTLLLYIINWGLSYYLSINNVSFTLLLIVNNISLIFYCFYVTYLLFKRVQYYTA